MLARRKRRSGQSIAELAVGLIVAIPIMLLLMDAVVIALGALINDSVCRDAARAAAAGPPAQYLPGADRNVPTGQPPNKRAVSVIKRVYQTGLPVKVRETPTVQESLSGPVPEPPVGGAIIGKVAVQTIVDINPPFLVGAICGPTVTLKSAHSCPFTYIRPSTP